MALHFPTEKAYQDWLKAHTRSQPQSGNIVQPSKSLSDKPVLTFDSVAKVYTVHEKGCTAQYSTTWFSTTTATDWPLEWLVLVGVAMVLFAWCLLS